LFLYTGVVTGNVVLLSLLELRLQAWLQTETMKGELRPEGRMS